jgi:LPS-assembly lipoprotein
LDIFLSNEVESKNYDRIWSKVDSVFAIKLKSHFNVEAAQSLVVQIDNEVQKKQTATYSNGVSSSYTLTLSVPVKIFRNKKKLSN